MSRLQRPNNENTASRTSGKPLNHRMVGGCREDVRPPAGSQGSSRFTLRYKRLTGRTRTSKSIPSPRAATQPSQGGEDALRGVRDVLCEAYEGRLSKCRSEMERLKDENNTLRHSLSGASQREVEEDLQLWCILGGGGLALSKPEHLARRAQMKSRHSGMVASKEPASVVTEWAEKHSGSARRAPTRASDEKKLRPVPAGQSSPRESSSARSVTLSASEKNPSAGSNRGEPEPSADETEGFVVNSLGRSSPPPHVKDFTEIAPEDPVSTFQGESSRGTGLIAVRYPDRVAQSADPVAVEYPRKRPRCEAFAMIVYPRHGGHGSDEVVKVRYPSDVILAMPRREPAEDLKSVNSKTAYISYPRVIGQTPAEVTYEGDGSDLGGQLTIGEQIPDPSSPSRETAAVCRSASAATYPEGEDTRADGSVHDDSGHAGEVRFPSPLGHKVSSTVIYPKPGPADESSSLAPVRYPSAPATSERSLFVEYPWRYSDEAASIISYPRCDGCYDDEGVPKEAAVPSLDDSYTVARPEGSSRVIEICATQEKSKGCRGVDEDSHMPPVPPAQPPSAGSMDSNADSKSSCGLSPLSMVDNSVSVAVTYPMIVIEASSSTKLIKIRYPDSCSLSGSSVSVDYPSNPSHRPLPNVVYPSVVKQRNSEVLQKAMVLPSSGAELRSAELCRGPRESPALAETIFYPHASI
ncbi:hypothetical protein FOZ63_007106 [Perkinsus olseni]|uniref:Uncharacterized protein n=1 Tax=Perkinsus olseni TaxID=32597 RepID=A0A7J6TGB0_PEROL|nr:hypothetical protein FOZ63_007106 [Perkinsus olseni]